MSSNYKAEHEAFFSNLEGGSIVEVALVLSNYAVSSCGGGNSVRQTLKEISSYAACTGNVNNDITFCGGFRVCHCTYAAGIYACRLCASYPGCCHSLIMLIVFAKTVWQHDIIVFNDPEQYKALCGTYKPFLSEYRSAILQNTFLGILAVDFPVFPRRFAKTETYGHSLMDVGVGAFVMASALTSKQAKGGGKSRLSNVLSTIKSRIPVLILGLVRILSVKATDYQEHVSEYGVHWNFFFTLAFIDIFLSLLAIPVQYNMIGGTVLIIGTKPLYKFNFQVYQFMLSFAGVAHYIEFHPRSNLFHQNKEGILSVIGYTSLYLFGTQLGRLLLKPRQNLQEWRVFTMRLWILDVLLWILMFLSDALIAQSSRRMANLTYVLSVLAMNTQNIASALLISLITKPTQSMITESINYNGLAMFLLANVCTGLVNLSIKTIYTPDQIAVGILAAYMTFVCLVAVVLYKFKIQLKFW